MQITSLHRYFSILARHLIQSIGVRGREHDWFHEYLQGRRQRVMIGSAVSTWLTLPHVDYCSVVWDQLTMDLEWKMETIQNVGMRIILNAPRMATRTEMRQKLGWCTLGQRRKLQSLKLAHKCLHNVGPTYLHHKFRYMSDVSGICTRGLHSGKLYIPEQTQNRILSKILWILNWKVVELSPFQYQSSMHVDVFCIHFKYVYMALLFLFVASLLPFIFRCTYAGLTWKSAVEAEVTTC